jgi:hypothetical protein
MKQIHRIGGACGLLCAGLVLVAMVGCKSSSAQTTRSSTKPAMSAQPVADSRPTIRIDAGAEAPLTDSQGVKWAADSGFDGGETVDRPELQVTGTKTPELYRTERYSMD